MLKAKKKHLINFKDLNHSSSSFHGLYFSLYRHARVRDEWESAALQNANTKCNGLLPLWGPQVTESSFASCLARFVPHQFVSL